MDDRAFIAAVAMEGILIGTFMDRPKAQPPPEKIAAQAVVYSDALREALKNTPDLCDPSPTPKA